MLYFHEEDLLVLQYCRVYYMIRCCPCNIAEYYANSVFVSYKFLQGLAVVWIPDCLDNGVMRIMNTGIPSWFYKIHVVIIRKCNCMPFLSVCQLYFHIRCFLSKLYLMLSLFVRTSAFFAIQVRNLIAGGEIPEIPGQATSFSIFFIML